MTAKKQKIKAFTARMGKDLWVFLKEQSIEKEESMNSMIVDCLEKYKKRCERRLTENDTTV